MVIFNELKLETQLYFKSKDEFMPKHLEFTLDAFIMGAIRTFTSNVSEDSRIDLNTATQIVLFKNLDLEKYNFNKTYLDNEYKYKSRIVEQYYSKFINDFDLLVNDKILYESLIRTLIESFHEEQIEVTKSYKNFNNGTGKVLMPLNFYFSIFIHPSLLLNESIEHNFLDLFYHEIGDVNYGELISKLGKKYNTILSIVSKI